jgi:hypothetical protein
MKEMAIKGNDKGLDDWLDNHDVGLRFGNLTHSPILPICISLHYCRPALNPCLAFISGRIAFS